MIVQRTVTHWMIGLQQRYGLRPRVEHEAIGHKPFRIGWAATPRRAVIAAQKGHDCRRHTKPKVNR